MTHTSREAKTALAAYTLQTLLIRFVERRHPDVRKELLNDFNEIAAQLDLDEDTQHLVSSVLENNPI